jgi:hypothetical protein
MIFVSQRRTCKSAMSIGVPISTPQTTRTDPLRTVQKRLSLCLAQAFLMALAIPSADRTLIGVSVTQKRRQ